MNRTELLNLVRTTSLNLMNACEGDGTIYACYGDDEIIAEFPGLMTKAQVIAKVRKMDSATADHLNEVLMFSGEYEMVNGVAVSKYQLEAQAELARIKAEAEADAEHEARLLADPEYAAYEATWASTNAAELEAERRSGFRPGWVD
jgi:hypothetical protein